MEKSAIISPCGKYRYSLRRRWAEGPSVGFIMLNPSTADAEVDDPTIRRCITFAKAWGYGALEVVNLFAYRATDPKELWELDCSEASGPGNFPAIVKACGDCKLLVAAWGTNGKEWGQDTAVKHLLGWDYKGDHGLHVLKLTKHGHPAHPLYLKADLKPIVWVDEDL